LLGLGFQWTLPGRGPLVRVLLQQNSVAHYRARLYECLSTQPGIRFEFVADPESDTPYLATATAASAIPFTPCPVWKLRLPSMPEIYFQPGAVLRLLLGEFDVAIALGSPYSLTTWMMLLLGPLVGTRVLLWTHGLLEPESGPKWWLRRLLYHSSAGLLLYGERARQLLLAQGSSPDRMFVVKNSLDPEAQAQAEAALEANALTALRQRLDLRAGDRALIFIGRLQPVKRLDLLVRAAGAFLARGQRVHVLLLGDGEEREALEQLSVEQGVRELVHFEGAKYREPEIAAYFASSDLCVIPSGAGLTVLHALGYGTPVLTHDRPELQFPEVEAIQPGETGAFYREGDMDSLLLALEAALFPEPMKVRSSGACRRRVVLDYGPVAHASRMAEAVRWAARA
jgi:glycosyltransferase involved in cell wall biosynthesis